MRVLVHRNFRYENDQVSAGEDVQVVLRSTSTDATLYAASSGATTLPNPIIADQSGNVSFYVEVGPYDFLVNGARVPFDAAMTTSLYVNPASIVGLPDGALIARTI